MIASPLSQQSFVVADNTGKEVGFDYNRTITQQEQAVMLQKESADISTVIRQQAKKKSFELDRKGKLYGYNDVHPKS